MIKMGIGPASEPSIDPRQLFEQAMFLFGSAFLVVFGLDNFDKHQEYNNE